MTVLAKEHRYTPDDLLAMPDGERYELVGGELMERHMGLLESVIGDKLQRLIGNYVEANHLGWTPNAECGYRCFAEEPARVRRPDASFIAGDRLSEGELRQGFVPIPPDLAVEVVSENDLYAEVRRKVGEYLSAGCRLVWVVDPESRSVEVWRLDGSVALLRSDAVLDGEAVLPGFQYRIADLFPTRQAPEASEHS